MNKRAQITLEACVLIALVATGLLATQGYLRRAIQAGWRTNADSFSDEQFGPGQSIEVFPDQSLERPGEPAIVFQNSRITALGQYFNVASLYNDILRIDGWGTYRSGAEDEE